MTPALTLLIASSAGWAAPEFRPTRLEVELLVAAVESAVIGESLSTTCAEFPESPLARVVPPVFALLSPAPALNDFRVIVRYDLSLPWVRTKP